MRILCLTARLPYPPDRGDRLRAFHIMRTLAREHELTLLSFIEGPRERAHAAELASLCGEVRVVERSRTASIVSALLSCWRPQPLQVLYYQSREMRSLVARTLAAGSFDLAYVHLFRMAPYLTDRPSYRIVDLTDLVSSEIGRSMAYRGLPSRALYALEGPRIARFERAAAEAAGEVWVISDLEREALAGGCPNAEVRVIPNGVDCERFRPLDGIEDPALLVLTGHMGVFHNVDAAIHLADDVLPLVRRDHPRCRLRLVGADPCRAVRRLGRRPGIEVSGWVDDLNLELNRAAAVVAPLRFQAGVQNKVLEAMAAGRPVVTSPAVAAALGAAAGRELLVAADAGDVAGSTSALLADVELRRRIGSAARSFVCRRFSWRAAAERVRELGERVGRR